MPLNEKKIINIILEECENVDERCEGYQLELIDVLTDIITAERQHSVRGTNIQQQINDRFNAAGRYLSEKRGANSQHGEDAS
jgi:hypothetical protein